jgi:hypothetical protein
MSKSAIAAVRPRPHKHPGDVSIRETQTPPSPPVFASPNLARYPQPTQTKFVTYPQLSARHPGHYCVLASPCPRPYQNAREPLRQGVRPVHLIDLLPFAQPQPQQIRRGQPPYPNGAQLACFQQALLQKPHLPTVFCGSAN